MKYTPPILHPKNNRNAVLELRWLGLLAALVSFSSTAWGTSSSIDSNFNGTNIADTSVIWFNAHLTSVTGASGPVTIYFTNQHITFTSPQTSIPYDLALPDSQVTIDPSFGTASVIFSGSWQTSVVNASGNPFLSGFAFDVPAGENPKASNPVTWTGDFSASQPGVSISWQWGAAVYTNFSTNYNSLGVTPIDGGRQSGTPVNFEGSVTGGARGGGGSNFTGSNSATGHATTIAIPEPSSVALLGSALALGLACRAWKKR
jgi:hypothetical protein